MRQNMELTQEQFDELFTHKGLLFGIYPVWVNDPEDRPGILTVRPWWPEWPADLLISTYFFFCELHDPFGEYEIPVKITGKRQ